jgi:acyl-CoA hydrolase
MTDWQHEYNERRQSADAALAPLRDGERVYVHMGAAAPQGLLAALCRRGENLTGVEVLHCITLGAAPYAEPRFAGRLRANTLFTAANVRAAVQEGRADHIPVFLHQIEPLFESGALPLDCALIQTAPPDAQGWLSLGPGIDISLTAARCARRLVVQVNPRMPRTQGDAAVHVSECAAVVEHEEELPEFHQGELTAVHRDIGRHVANLIPDEATLQIGVGGIPDAVLMALAGHKDLGIHTEMFTDALLPLIASGAVNNRRKTLHPGKIITSFALGSRALYDWLHQNAGVEFHRNRYTNDPFVIGQNRRMAAVNAALEVDLSGQVCSDSVGTKIYSGFGGQVDFIRGAARSEGGVPVIALPSTAGGGRISRIVPALKPGAGVVTSRADVRWVATEFGAVNLYGKNLRQRAELLISIAHPDFQSDLEREAARRLG